MAYMSPEAAGNFFTAALPNDGFMDLIVIEGNLSRTKSILLQTSVETGKFFDDPCVSYQKISGYRMVPRKQNAGGYISIDGERIPFESFQAEVHHGLGLTYSMDGNYFGPGPKGWDLSATSLDGEGPSDTKLDGEGSSGSKPKSESTSQASQTGLDPAKTKSEE